MIHMLCKFDVRGRMVGRESGRVVSPEVVGGAGYLLGRQKGKRTSVSLARWKRDATSPTHEMVDVTTVTLTSRTHADAP